jgi:hypothetical protein
MLYRRFNLATITALAAVIAFSVSANAATVLKSGDTVGGWTITFPAGISLISDGLSGDGVTLKLEKGATFTSMEGLVIRFVQSSFNAASEIAIVNETVTNLSGQNWIGFDFLVADQGLGNNGTVQFKSPADVFNNIAPFTTTIWSPTKVSLRDGVLPHGQTAQWGFDDNGPGSGGDLVILSVPEANGGRYPSHTFDFKEIPIIPLPAAAWTGLSGLFGLGLIAFGKNVRRMLA